MDQKDSQDVARTLSTKDVHKKWEADYRTRANEPFYEMVFNDFEPIFRLASSRSLILDAGCGSCRHSIRIAGRGFKVLGVDFSEAALRSARESVHANLMDDRIHLQRASLLSLPLRPETLDVVLCWGVLMHIPELERALDELERVIRSGGYLIISEVNMRSLQAITLRFLKRMLRLERAELRQTPAGIEVWTVTEQGRLLTRETRIPWLIYQLEKRGFILRTRCAGQFTEIYTRINSPAIKAAVNKFNRFWYRYFTFPLPAFGNILLFEKEVPSPGGVHYSEQMQ